MTRDAVMQCERCTAGKLAPGQREELPLFAVAVAAPETGLSACICSRISLADCSISLRLACQPAASSRAASEIEAAGVQPVRQDLFSRGRSGQEGPMQQQRVVQWPGGWIESRGLLLKGLPGTQVTGISVCCSSYRADGRFAADIGEGEEVAVQIVSAANGSENPLTLVQEGSALEQALGHLKIADIQSLVVTIKHVVLLVLLYTAAVQFSSSHARKFTLADILIALSGVPDLPTVLLPRHCRHVCSSSSCLRGTPTIQSKAPIRPSSCSAVVCSQPNPLRQGSQ